MHQRSTADEVPKYLADATASMNATRGIDIAQFGQTPIPDHLGLAVARAL